MSRAACRKSPYARRSPKGVSGNTVEGFDAAGGDFRHSPVGRADFGRLVRRRALMMRPALPAARERLWRSRLPFAPKSAASCALARAARTTRP